MASRGSEGRKELVNLALQGGGAHGALTWGALDALLAETRLSVDGVSGTSAGAVNAVALAAGLMEGGRDGARAKLEEIWHAISRFGAPASYPRSLLADSDTLAMSGAVIGRTFRQLRSIWSPFDLNPLDLNPLRDILETKIDFDALRGGSPVRLFIAATEVTSGRVRVFTTEEISIDVVLASTCLPLFSPAIRVGRHHYWDGGFSANPDLLRLIAETDARDTILIQISPDRDPVIPKSSEEITGSIGRLTFTQPLRCQIEHIETCRRVPRLPGLVEKRIRRLGGHRFHLVDGSRYTLGLAEDTKAKPDWALISRLHEKGRELASDWVAGDLRHVGRRSSVDLYARYIGDRLPFD